MNDVEKRALRAVTRSVVAALENYADAMGAPLREPHPWPLEKAGAEVVHAFDSLLAIEPEPAVRETYAWDQGRFASLTVPEIHTLANDYRAMADSPPESPDPKPAPSEPTTPRYYFNPLMDPPARVTIVGGSWDGAKGTDSGNR